jgi:hypothetical protein
LVEHWNGTSWSIVSNPVFASNGVAFAVSADSANDIWILVGSKTFLHFDGTNWSSVASPMGTTSVTALSPTNVWAVGTVPGGTTGGYHRRPLVIAAIEHWDGTRWSIVASPNPAPGANSNLQGIAAISANDIWAVGSIGAAKTLTEHWDGISWSIIPSPSPAANQNELFAVTALRDGTVAAVGHQEDVNMDQPLILQNAASAPPAGGSAALLTTTAAPNGLTPAPLNVELVDQFFAPPARAHQPLSLAGSASGAAPKAANSGELNDLTEGISLWQSDWKSGLAWRILS